MKKTVTLLGLTALVVLGSTGAYQFSRSKNQNPDEIDYEDFYIAHPYEQVTPDAKIVEGNETAVAKIETFVGKKLTVGNPWPTGSGLETSVVRGNDGLQYFFKVEDYADKDISIFYLFHDDVDVVQAANTSENYVDEKEVNLADYSNAINDVNYISNPGFTTFAWKFESDSYVVADETVTSVWSLENGSELHLIWCNKECPIWTNYNG